MKTALSIEETCNETGLGRTKLYQLIGENKLHAKKIGRRTIILRSDLENFLSSLDSYPSSN